MLISRDAVKTAEEELGKLEPEKLTSYQIVERMYDSIEKTRARGVSYDKIFETLGTSVGWNIKLSTFRQYLKKIRLEREKAKSEDNG